MIGPELDLLEGGHGPGVLSTGERIEHALLWENTRSSDGRPMRWAGFSVTGNAGYVSLLGLRAHFLAHGIHPSPRMAYQRHYQLLSEAPRTTVWSSTR
jgi:hypothetical protein